MRTLLTRGIGKRSDGRVGRIVNKESEALSAANTAAAVRDKRHDNKE